jgi:hypothetical protein
MFFSFPFRPTCRFFNSLVFNNLAFNGDRTVSRVFSPKGLFFHKHPRFPERFFEASSFRGWRFLSTSTLAACRTCHNPNHGGGRIGPDVRALRNLIRASPSGASRANPFPADGSAGTARAPPGHVTSGTTRFGSRRFLPE